MTHQRRTGGIKGTVVQFDDDMILTVKKELLLLNTENKQTFINCKKARISRMYRIPRKK